MLWEGTRGAMIPEEERDLFRSEIENVLSLAKAGDPSAVTSSLMRRPHHDGAAAART